MKNETLHIRICPRCGASYGRTPSLSRAERLSAQTVGHVRRLRALVSWQRNRNRSLKPSTGRSGKIHNFFHRSLCTL